MDSSAGHLSYCSIKEDIDHFSRSLSVSRTVPHPSDLSLFSSRQCRRGRYCSCSSLCFMVFNVDRRPCSRPSTMRISVSISSSSSSCNADADASCTRPIAPAEEMQCDSSIEEDDDERTDENISVQVHATDRLRRRQIWPPMELDRSHRRNNSADLSTCL